MSKLKEVELINFKNTVDEDLQDDFYFALEANDMIESSKDSLIYIDPIKRTIALWMIFLMSTPLGLIRPEAIIVTFILFALTITNSVWLRERDIKSLSQARGILEDPLCDFEIKTYRAAETLDRSIRGWNLAVKAEKLGDSQVPEKLREHGTRLAKVKEKILYWIDLAEHYENLEDTNGIPETVSLATQIEGLERMERELIEYNSQLENSSTTGLLISDTLIQDTLREVEELEGTAGELRQAADQEIRRTLQTPQQQHPKQKT